jgi:hypothetical protein
MRRPPRQRRPRQSRRLQHPRTISAGSIPPRGRRRRGRSRMCSQGQERARRSRCAMPSGPQQDRRLPPIPTPRPRPNTAGATTSAKGWAARARSSRQASQAAPVAARSAARSVRLAPRLAGSSARLEASAQSLMRWRWPPLISEAWTKAWRLSRRKLMHGPTLRSRAP